MGFFYNLLWVLVLIGVMILVHELGHFWAARYFDVKVDAFSFGFGPRLFGFRRGETDYRVSAIPFGGYVKMAGEQAHDAEAVDDPRGFMRKPRWQRLIIAFAGPFMNVVLSVFLLTGLFMVQFQKIVEDGGAVIGHIIPNSPADKAGLQDGDRIIQIEGEKNPTWEDIHTREMTSAARPLEITIERHGSAINKQVTPLLDQDDQIGLAGWEERSQILVGNLAPGKPGEAAGLKAGDLLLSINGEEIRSPFKLQDTIRGTQGRPVVLVVRRGNEQKTISVKPVYSTADKHFIIGIEMGRKLDVIDMKLGPVAALRESLHENARSASLIYLSLKGIVERRLSPKALQGPIGMARISGEAARLGAPVFIKLMAAVSVNLAIFNLLPIPILDGGVILMLLIEMLMGRDLSAAVKEGVLKAGFVFLMAVVVFVLYNDISKILPQG
jgi:regulator of sigma E protease